MFSVKEDTPAFSTWIKAARDFQCKMREKFQSREYDNVPAENLKDKISAAYNEIGANSLDTNTIVDQLKNIRDIQWGLCSYKPSYNITFVYVHVKVDGENTHYTFDVVCRFEKTTNGCIFIDINGRVYKNWDDYLFNNTLPKGRMYYPKDGIYVRNGSCCIWHTPAAQFKNQALSALDSASTVVGTVADLATVASLFMPGFGMVALGKAIVKKALVTSFAANGYSAARNVQKLSDRYQHSQSISFTNAEARELWVNAAVYGLSAATTGMSLTKTYSALASSSSFCRSAIVASSGLHVLRVNLIIALDTCFNSDMKHIASFKANCLLMLNIISPLHEFKVVLLEIKSLTSFLGVLNDKACNHLKLLFKDDYEHVMNSKPAKYIKNLIHISGRFIMNICLADFEKLINNLKESIKQLLKGDVAKFDSLMSEACKQILVKFQEPWIEANQEDQGTFKRNDLHVEDFRKIYSMLNVIEEQYKLDSISMRKLPNLINRFSFLCGSYSKNKYLKRVKGFCSFLKKEVQSKIDKRISDEEFFGRINSQQVYDMEQKIDAWKTQYCKKVIDNFDLVKCVMEYHRYPVTSNVPSLELSGISQYLFVEDNVYDLDDSRCLKILKDETGTDWSINKSVIVRRPNIVQIENCDENSLALFYTEERECADVTQRFYAQNGSRKGHSNQLQGVLTFINNKHKLQ